jgi:hypothetical protein
MKAALAVLASLICVSAVQAQRQPLKGLTRLKIVAEDMGEVGTAIRLSPADVEAEALVAVRRDIPALKIDPDANSYLYINVTGIPAGTGYAFHLRTVVNRPVAVLDETFSISFGRAIAAVWNSGAIFFGSADTMSARIRQTIDNDIVQFAADYYKQNPN